VSPLRCAEDYQPGMVFELGSYNFTAEEIITFSRIWDPQPFHIDEAAARKTMFKGLIASGWHTALVMMRMMHQGGFLSLETSVGSPGHDEVRWLAPVRPGEPIAGRVTVTGVRLSASRPNLGFVAHDATFTSSDGTSVYLLKSTAIILTRAGLAASRAAALT
jgi:acyl dehydratase